MSSWFGRCRSVALSSMLFGCSNVGNAPTDDRPDGRPASDARVSNDAMVEDGSVPGDARADAMVDAGTPDAPPDAPLPEPVRRRLYPEGTRHSPIDERIVTSMQAIATANSRQARVFAKIGDSHTASTKFLACFDGGTANLGSHSSLAPTVAYFDDGNAAGTSPFARTSSAAVGGSTAKDALAGMPCTLQREIDTIDPQLAVILFGTNEIRYGWSFDDFGASLWELVDKTITNGVVPVMSTIPPIGGDPGTDARIPTANRIVRAIAQGREVPLVDLHRELLPLANRGLDTDQIHLSSSPEGTCTLTDPALHFGQNVRNLITIEALARAKAALEGSASGGAVAERMGAGTAADPYRGSLPLVDLANTADGVAQRGSYSCAARPQTGRELVYRIDLASSTTLEANVVDRGTVDADVHIIAQQLASGPCLASGDKKATVTAGPGPIFIVVDTPSAANEGELILVVEKR